MRDPAANSPSLTRMHWSAPAKTFLVGEYAALKGQSALLLTTTPYFELRSTEEPGLHGIHPHSPAGRWWAHCNLINQGLVWHDPYQEIGGMGASSAQFLMVYQACAQLQGCSVTQNQLIQDYRQFAAGDAGVPPSGYDVLAQMTQGCVYLNQQTGAYEQYTWPFTDLGFIVVHSQKKLATHDHLQTLRVSDIPDQLGELVDYAKTAFLTQTAYHLVEVVKAYHQILYEQGWVAPHSLQLIQRLYQETDALAIKGCGAMGSDVLLLLVRQTQLSQHIAHLLQTGWQILATNTTLTRASTPV